MNKALPCFVCGEEDQLQFKHNSADRVAWIHCDRCGNRGPVAPSYSEAGEAWNKQQTENK